MIHTQMTTPSTLPLVQILGSPHPVAPKDILTYISENSSMPCRSAIFLRQGQKDGGIVFYVLIALTHGDLLSR